MLRGLGIRVSAQYAINWPQCGPFRRMRHSTCLACVQSCGVKEAPLFDVSPVKSFSRDLGAHPAPCPLKKVLKLAPATGPFILSLGLRASGSPLKPLNPKPQNPKP